MESGVEFLNADLEIRSKFDLIELRDYLLDRNERISEMGLVESENLNFVSFEIHPTGTENATSTELIEAFCDELQFPEEKIRKLWNLAESRVIDLGFQASKEGISFQDLIPANTLARLSEFNIDLAITIYPERLTNS